MYQLIFHAEIEQKIQPWMPPFERLNEWDV